jgi:hypothetical protein
LTKTNPSSAKSKCKLISPFLAELVMEMGYCGVCVVDIKNVEGGV